VHREEIKGQIGRHMFDVYSSHRLAKYMDKKKGNKRE